MNGADAVLKRLLLTFKSIMSHSVFTLAVPGKFRFDKKRLTWARRMMVC